MDLEAENQQLKQENAQLQQTLQAALQKIKELEARLGQHSQNSNWPSSRDVGKKKKPVRSLRGKSGKKPGGQKGHKGHTLEFHPEPDEVVIHRPSVCDHCHQPLDEEAETVEVKTRQRHDLPPIEFEVTEHQAQRVLCQACGEVTQASFPKEVSNPVQYGPKIKQLALYLKHQQLIPYDRVRQLFTDLFDLNLSPGTLQNFTRKGAERIEPIMERVKMALSRSDVIHVDESGFYIAGERHWLHVTSNECLTYYYPHQSRGREGLDEIEVLLGYQGVAIHDNFPSYWKYACDHGLCNVHHLRELRAVQEKDDQIWSVQFEKLLLAAKEMVAQAFSEGKIALEPAQLERIDRLYDQLVDAALRANPPPETGWPRGTRGREKKPKARNLAERFQKRKREILAFVYDFKVPFDNNLAERDIRMLKVQQKISGCFRSPQGAEDFCTIRGYISTLRKQGLNVWDALGSIFSEHILYPDLTPV